MSDTTISPQSRGTSAVLGVIAGVLLIRDPVPGVTMVALLLGTWLVALGAVRLIRRSAS